ncbi:MAG: hypothetical protein JWR47_1925 [Phenylobacterium sp.]|jgi:hypothetical protein|uniref:hypothetical protein n=1 Tax=Phenylobacterium sp. TaxID=1871053 RepID=UPI002616512F|nr:hypothetical protein [Phenylobacterium sp.]MDB5435668.1 hypothetical protein [Phenylobacterium sp.]MDB5464966.1 hypothetical protein [Phenylobacterium sp.]MDB5498206.1 hypothetical protein [Phenylobacterium sp.]
MASKAPPIPREQRPPRGRGRAKLDDGKHDRRDLHDGVQSNEPGDADVNLKLQGRYGDRYQNVDTVHWKVQDR